MTCGKCEVAPGGTLNVSGAYFQANNTLALSLDDGTSLGVAQTNSGGSFRHTFQAPSQPGSYTVIAKNANGTFRSGLPARLSFEVRAPSSTNAPSAVTPPRTVTPQPQRGPAFNEPGVSPSPSQGQPNAGGGGQQQSGATPGNSPSPVTTQGGGSGIGSGGGSGGSGSGGGGGDIGGGPGGDVFAGSVAPNSGSSSPTFDESRAADPATAGGSTPSEQAAGGDVWSGFGSGSNASLIPSATDAAPDSGTGSGFGLGIGLLALGLVALVSGVAVAEVRRRRALAG